MPVTENKLKILKFIYENEDAYLLTISRELKIHPFSLKRTIDNLIKNKILEPKKIGKTIRLGINPTFRDYGGLLYEIEKYKAETKNKALKRIIKNIRLHFADDKDILSCVLFGSYARGAQTKESDVDLLFLTRNRRAKNNIVKKCSELSSALNVDITPVILTEKEFLISVEEKDPAMISLLKPIQRLIVFGVENFLKVSSR